MANDRAGTPPWHPVPGGDDAADVFLQPGEIWFGEQPTRIRTLLGSCVAITLWHPQRRIGGMCHYLLPAAPAGQRPQFDEPPTEFDGRYAEGAIGWFLERLRRCRTEPGDYEVKMFGGGAQFANTRGRRDGGIPDDNVAAGHALLAQHGFTLSAEHIGGCGRRNVIFELATGAVWMRHVDAVLSAGAAGQPVKSAGG